MTATTSRPARILAVADSDSYLKWGAATLATLTDVGETELVLLRSPILPSPAQRAAALTGTGTSAGLLPAGAQVPVLTPRQLRDRLRATDPDVVLLAATGPVAELVVRIVGRTYGDLGGRRLPRGDAGSPRGATGGRPVAADARPRTARPLERAAGARPALVGGLPGMSYPATLRALRFRAGQDLFVVHSRREAREFAAVAEHLGLDLPLALGPLPFLPARVRTGPAGSGAAGIGPAGTGAAGTGTAGTRAAGTGAAGCGTPDTSAPLTRVVFAPQAKMPVTRAQREQVLRALARLAAARPDVDVVVKVRGLAGEAQTHREALPFDTLLDGLVASGDVPAGALRVATGPLADQLVPGAALVTVSSTAALESLAAGLPTLVLEDFGVNERMLNAVFLGSGCLGTLDDLAAGRFGTPDARWLEDNYLHDAPSELPDAVRRLVASRRADALVPLRAALRGGVVLGRARRRLVRTFVRSQAPDAVLAVLGAPGRARRAVQARRRRLLRALRAA